MIKMRIRPGGRSQNRKVRISQRCRKKYQSKFNQSDRTSQIYTYIIMDLLQGIYYNWHHEVVSQCSLMSAGKQSGRDAGREVQKQRHIRTCEDEPMRTETPLDLLLPPNSQIQWCGHPAEDLRAICHRTRYKPKAGIQKLRE